ncbi:amidohydrolase [uncultured Anaerococcus sp.]|uniref:amidohydrolase n=1 Tax=uncultured Anaerococcus sp. TaxID=293428 RepID=UPI002622E793|nr:amidohydrolase [uncultured Anaerococcus sp.]
MASNELIKEKIEECFDDTLSWRTYLHENPEVSDKEYKTASYLKKECEKLGLIVEDAANTTGFTALLDTGRPGKNLGIRTDIDALPIAESTNNLKNKKTVVSKNEGVSHACGHDSHMATLLTSAKILTHLKDELNGKIYFIFEEGEETGGGIDAMIEHLKDKNLDACYGNHQSPFLEIGQIKVLKGPSHAGCAGVEFDVIGKGGHGSRPDKCINPLTATANIITALTNAWVNQLDVTKTVTFGLGSINGGSASNVIPNRCNVKGTLRFFDDEAGEEALEVLKEVTRATAKAHKCDVEFSDYSRIVAYPTINDPDLAEKVRTSLNDIYPEALLDGKPTFGSESFFGYSRLCPSVYTKFGIRDEENGISAGPHTAEFDLNPEGIKYAVGLQVKFATDFLGGVFND